MATNGRKAELVHWPVLVGWGMNRRLSRVIVLALIIASGCAFLVYRLASSRIGGARQASLVRVVAAKENVKVGALLAAADLTTIQIAGTLPKGSILKAENAIGRGVIANLYQGEPILEDRLAPSGSGGGMAATIPSGMRACAVKVDEVVGVAGFVTPGMRVDVLTSGTPSGNSSVNADVMANTILQNIEVLSAGTDIQKDSEGKPQQVRVVNVLVTPEQAEILSLATHHLTIQLVLRNPLDTKIATVPRTTLASLLAGDTPRAPAPARSERKIVSRPEAPHAYVIEVVSGSKRSELKIALPEEQK